MKKKGIVIAGPCALESREQLRRSVQGILPWNPSYIRASIWKPRTCPSWDGIGSQGIFTLLEETLPYGVMPATEVLLPQHVVELAQALKQFDANAHMLLWLGARNQNHLLQQMIASAILEQELPFTLMVKNQPWPSQTHWEGIIRHLLASGLANEQLLLCHRGFSVKDSSIWRNEPDLSLAKEVAETTALPLVLDPSHIAGDRQRIAPLIEAAMQRGFSGFMVEVHPDPSKAKTDAHQQLSLEEFAALMESKPLESRQETLLC